MNTSRGSAGFCLLNSATVCQCRCPTQTVRNCQMSVLVVGTSPSLRLLTMLRLPFFLGLQNELKQTSWTYWLLVYHSCSSCPLIIITSESKLCRVQPHTSLLAGCCIVQNDWSILIKWLFALGFAGFGFTFEGLVYGVRKWRHISQNVRLVLHVAYVIGMYEFTSSSLIWHDNLCLNCSGKLAYSIFYNCFINVKVKGWKSSELMNSETLKRLSLTELQSCYNQCSSPCMKYQLKLRHAAEIMQRRNNPQNQQARESVSGQQWWGISVTDICSA